MASREYNTLFQSIKDLKDNLLNFEPSPTVPYTVENLLKCQAFVVFSHAEMQVYWESIARRILQEAERRWKANSIVDRVIGALVSFRRPDRVSIPSDPLNPHSGGDFAWIVQEAIKTQNDVIVENNGIKRANLANLLMPLGLLPGDFVETMLIQLDQTGAKRGDMVHRSSKTSLRKIRDPFSDELKDIDDVVSEIGIFDTKLVSLGLLQT